MAAAARAQAEAETALLEAQRAAAAGADEDAAAQDRLAAAGKALAGAQKESAASAKVLADAQKAQSDTAAAAAAKDDEAAAAQKRVSDSAAASGVSLAKVGKVAGVMALGLGIAGAVMVKAAGNFQDSTTHLVTDAGESAKNLAMVQSGILRVSTATGQSAADITNAMYHIESSGLHGAQGLAVLRTAAEGARVGGADLDTTSKALMGTLTAYYGTSMTAAQATARSTSLMNQLIATVGSGDMRMQDLASALSAVTPVAAAAHVSFAQVGAAIATMTSQGMSAQQATQDLANMMRNVLKPSATASAEMRALGLNANQVQAALGSQGITGTLQEYTNAILANTKGGSVLIGDMKQMTPATQALARAILQGTISTKALRTASYSLSPVQAKLLSLFDASATSATGLKQTFTGAMATLTGGATGLNVSLMLSGKHMKTFTGDVAGIGAKAKDASGNVAGWSVIQSTFNFKLAAAKTAVENTGIAIGTALLPAATSLMKTVTDLLIPVVEWTSRHRTLTMVLFIGVTALAATVAAVSLATKAFKAVKGAVDSVKAVVSGTESLFKKLGGASKTSAAEQEASAGEAAAAQEAAAAEGAAAQEEAAASSSASWIASAASTVASWAATGARMVAQAAVWVASNTAKVAVVVAENIAGALATAAAWVAANAAMTLGIGLVIAAVAAAVYLIVTHWHTIVDGVKEAWNAVYDFISKVIRDVISFVKSHWVLIVGLITGPLGLAVIEIVKHWDQIREFCSRTVSDVLDFLRSHWMLIAGILGGPLVAAVLLVVRYWGDIRHWFAEGTSRVLGILRGLAGDVVSIGGDIVRGLWQGISQAGGWLLGQVKGFAGSVLHSIGSFFGIGSPSKYTTYHGLMLGAGVAAGMLQSIGRVAAAGRAVAAAALGGTSSLTAQGATAGIGSALAASAAAPAYGQGSGTQVNLYVTGNTVMSRSDMDELVERIGGRLATVTLPAGGRKLNIRG